MKFLSNSEQFWTVLQLNLLRRIGGQGFKEATRNVLNRLFSNYLQSFMNLDGRIVGKHAIRNQPICSVIVGKSTQLGIDESYFKLAVLLTSCQHGSITFDPNNSISLFCRHKQHCDIRMQDRGEEFLKFDSRLPTHEAVARLNVSLFKLARILSASVTRIPGINI